MHKFNGLFSIVAIVTGLSISSVAAGQGAIAGSLSDSAENPVVAAIVNDHPMRDGRFESEPIDPQWAPEMQAALRNVVAEIAGDMMEVEQVQCRTSVCRAVLGHTSAYLSMDDEQRRVWFRQASQRFSDAVSPLVEGSDGRLNSIGIAGTTSRNPDQPSSTIFYVHGAPSRDTSADR